VTALEDDSGDPTLLVPTEESDSHGCYCDRNSAVRAGTSR